MLQEFVEDSNTKIETMKRKKKKVVRTAQDSADAGETQHVASAWPSHKPASTTFVVTRTCCTWCIFIAWKPCCQAFNLVSWFCLRASKHIWWQLLLFRGDQSFGVFYAVSSQVILMVCKSFDSFDWGVFNVMCVVQFWGSFATESTTGTRVRVVKWWWHVGECFEHIVSWDEVL